MRVVIDTNVWLSGLMLPGSVPGHIVRAASVALSPEDLAALDALPAPVGARY